MRTKKVKPPPQKFEYILTISKQFDSIKNSEYISFLFETAKKFLTFKYILKMECSVENNIINFNVLGFTAPIGELSSSGTAGNEFRLYDFKFKEYRISVKKNESEVTKFNLLINKSISNPFKLSNISKKRFLEIIISNDS